MMSTIVLVDDHPMIRRGFSSYLAGTGRFSVTGEAGSLEEAYALFEGLPVPPGLVLLDIELGSDNGLDLLSYLKKRYSPAEEPAALVYSIFEDPFRIQSALYRGARGYVSKSAREEEIAKALDAILNNKIYVEPKLAEKTMQKPDLYQGLTKQERKILDLIQRNYGNRQIAQTLSLELRTIENYLTRLYAKTGAVNRGELIKL